MSNVMVCTNCHRRAHVYSYEWADRSGVLDGSWRCPACGGLGSIVVAAPIGEFGIPTRAYQRVGAVLRALEVIGETTLTADALDRETLLRLDDAILAAEERVLEPSPY